MSANLVHQLSTALEGAPVRLAVLFGSVARGTDHAGSDVDVAILAESTMALGEELALEQRLSSACGREAQVVRLDQEDDLLRWEIARDGVLLKGDRSEFLRFVVAAAREHADQAYIRNVAGQAFRRRIAESR